MEATHPAKTVGITEESSQSMDHGFAQLL